jgi:hypothetical protein
MEFVSTDDGRVRSVKCCVLFDISSGEIQLVHRVVDLDGADETADEDVVRRALALANDVRLNTAALEALLVEPSTITGSTHYRVDTRTKSLIEMPAADASS